MAKEFSLGYEEIKKLWAKLNEMESVIVLLVLERNRKLQLEKEKFQETIFWGLGITEHVRLQRNMLIWMWSFE